MERCAFLSKLRLIAGFGAMLLGSAACAQGGDAAAMAIGAGRLMQGTVTAVKADHVTVRTAQGEVYQVSASANTRVSRKEEAGPVPIKFGEIRVNEGVGVMGEIDPAAKTVHALFVTVLSADDLRKVREALGRTVIVGTVTAIRDLKLTIRRPDGVEQAIVVDEGTSFRRGGPGMLALMSAYGGGGGTVDAVQAPVKEGESITLADVKVGSTVAGKGGMKNGMFVPTELGVRDPGAGRQRRTTAPPPDTPPSMEPR